MTNTQKAIALPVFALAVLLGGAMLGYAQLSNAGTDDTARFHMGMRGDGIHGTITALDGSTITVEGRNGTTYTVAASDAEVRVFKEGEGPVDTSLSDLSVGDMIGVRGEVDGTRVTATGIMSGHLERGMMGGHGRGRHGVMGEVTEVDGSTITVKNYAGTTYTIDAGEATVSRVVTGALSDIVVGDRIGVHGTLNDGTVDATHIMDDIKEPQGDE